MISYVYVLYKLEQALNKTYKEIYSKTLLTNRSQFLKSLQVTHSKGKARKVNGDLHNKGNKKYKINCRLKIIVHQ